MVAAGTDGNKIFVGPGINVLIAAGPGIDFDGVGPGFAINFMRTAVYSNLVVSFFSINIMFGSAVYRDYIPVKPSGNPLAVSRAFFKNNSVNTLIAVDIAGGTPVNTDFIASSIAMNSVRFAGTDIYLIVPFIAIYVIVFAVNVDRVSAKAAVDCIIPCIYPNIVIACIAIYRYTAACTLI